MAHLFAWLNSLGIDTSNVLLADYVSPRKVMDLVYLMLSLVRGLFTHMFLVFLTVLFILIEAAGFPGKLQAAFPDPEKPLGHFKAMTTSVNQYMGVKAIFSLATGVSVWIVLALLGVDFAGTWGLLAFFLNFIPSIGSIIAAVPAILLALLQLGLPAALEALLGYLVMNITHRQLPGAEIHGAQTGLVHPGGVSVAAVLGMGSGPHRHGAFRAPHHDWLKLPWPPMKIPGGWRSCWSRIYPGTLALNSITRY